MNPKMSSLRGWIDYDRPFLSGLSSAERILYFRKRLSLVLLKPLEDLYNAINRQPNYSPLLIFATSVCCSIEALGKFKTGGLKTQNMDRFYGFVDPYMHPDYRTKLVAGKLYKYALWKHYRNGLAHGFAVCHGGFEGLPGYFAVRNIAGHDSLMINPKHFYADFRNGVAKYLLDLRKSKSSDLIRKNFDLVFTDVFINGN